MKCTCTHLDSGHSANGPSGAYVGKGRGRCMFCACEGFRSPPAISARLLAAFAIVALSFSLSGCPKPLPVPVPPDSGDGAAPAVDGPPTCARFCDDGRRAGCSWARDTKAGATCEDVCFNSTTGGPLVWDLGCRVEHLETGRGCASVDLCP
jgi:hypothetical protein